MVNMFSGHIIFAFILRHSDPYNYDKTFVAKRNEAQ